MGFVFSSISQGDLNLCLSGMWESKEKLRDVWYSNRVELTRRTIQEDRNWSQKYWGVS